MLIVQDYKNYKKGGPVTLFRNNSDLSYHFHNFKVFLREITNLVNTIQPDYPSMVKHGIL